MELRLVNDDDFKTNLVAEGSGATAGDVVPTNKEGYASFKQVPQAKTLRVKVLNAPKGATVTLRNKGGDAEADSDLQGGDLSDTFQMKEAGVYTEIDLGYQLPTEMVVRVWNDQDNDGLQGPDEKGIEGVKLRLIYAKTGKNLEPQESGTAHEEMVTDDSGIVTFSGVAKGVDLKVKVVNAPDGAVRATQNAGKNKNEDTDSDLGKDGSSHSFNLAKFTGSTFDSIDFGYLLPVDMTVRVWDDLDSDGVQSDGEVGIEGIQLQLINDDKAETPLETHDVLTTDVNGLVTFVDVPKSKKLRVKLLNPPVGATVTRKNTGRNQDGADNTDSDLDAKKMASDSFNMASFEGDGVHGSIDLGLKLPVDTQVRVWDDLNGT